MNKYDQERINMIAAMLMYITKLPTNKIFSYMKKTQTYSNILNGDELTLYDSYAANIMDMTNEWKEKRNIPSVLRNITAQQVNASNAWLRTQEIKDAKQAHTLLALRRKPRRFNMTSIPVSIRKISKASGTVRIPVSKVTIPAMYKKRNK